MLRLALTSAVYMIERRRHMRIIADCTITPAAPANVLAIAALLRTAERSHADFAAQAGNFLVTHNGGGTAGTAVSLACDWREPA